MENVEFGPSVLLDLLARRFSLQKELHADIFDRKTLYMEMSNVRMSWFSKSPMT